MTLEQIRKEIDKEFPIVKRKAAYVIHKLQRTYAKRLKEQDLLFQFDYRSKFHNNWIYQIEIGKKKAEHSFLVYFNGEKGLAAISTLASGEIIYCTGHFFRRYRERLKLDTVMPGEVMRAFLKDNRVHCFNFLDETEPGVTRIFTTMDRGTGLGVYHKREGVYRLKTFITFDMLRGKQRTLDKTAKSTINDFQSGVVKPPAIRNFISPELPRGYCNPVNLRA